MASNKPNILFLMTDQQRFDTIRKLGNLNISTPNFDRLVERGVTFTNAYSPCPVCVPARLIIRTGCSSLNTACWDNYGVFPVAAQSPHVEENCGRYLPKVMSNLGYRTFGIGKFHPPQGETDIGYDTYLQSTEADGEVNEYADYIYHNYPAYRHIEQLHGERTDMYYQPQTSPLPADLTVEAWAADQAIKMMNVHDDRPWFGFVSFIGPHPPFAPPVPYNRMYDPDAMPLPVSGDPKTDHMDERIPWNNYYVYAEDVSPRQWQTLKARYYGEISYIDSCIGRILDDIEAREEDDNTLICFFSDHGELMGDHNAVQKEGFFEGSAHISFLLSWPQRLPKDVKNPSLASLTDLFAIATTAAGKCELRDGVNLLAVAEGSGEGREHLIGYASPPGDRNFRLMVRKGPWKYNFHANGGGEQLFNIPSDPNELQNLADKENEVKMDLRAIAIAELSSHPAGRPALCDGELLVFPRQVLETERCRQFSWPRGITDFHATPEEVKEPLPYGQ